MNNEIYILTHTLVGNILAHILMGSIFAHILMGNIFAHILIHNVVRMDCSNLAYILDILAHNEEPVCMGHTLVRMNMDHILEGILPHMDHSKNNQPICHS